MAEPIKSSEIIEDGLFIDAIKQADDLIIKLKALEVQQGLNLKASQAYINAFKGDDSKALKQLNAETVKVTATLSEYEKTQLGIIEVEKKQAQLKAELAKTSREELKLTKDLAKEEAARLKVTTAQTGEYSKASKELAKLKRELQDLIIAEKTNTKEFKELNKQFEDLDKKVRKADASVGNFQRNVGNYPAQLKAMQRELQGLEPGSKAFNDLAQKAGLLKDAIGDAKDATKAFATESKATTAKTLFGQIGNDLADLDFKGAAEKSSQFASVIKSISFAEVIAGVKSFGSAMLTLGKSLLLNPFMLLAAGVAALAYAAYDLISTFKEMAVQTDVVNKSLETSQKRIEDLTKLQIDYMIRIRIARGQLTKEDGELLKQDIANSDARKDLTKKFGEDIIALAEKLNIDLTKLKNGKADVNQIFGVGKKELLERERFNKDYLVLQRQFHIDYRVLAKTQVLATTADKAESDKEEADALKKKNEEDAKKDKEERDKKAKAAKEERDRKIKQAKEDQLEIDKAAQATYADSINREADKYDKDRAKAKKDAKDWEALQREFDSDLERDVKKGEEDAAKNKKERQEKELKEAIEFEKQILDAFSKAQAEKSKLKIEGYDKELKDADKNIDMQRQLAIKGAKNTLIQAEADKARIEREKEDEKEKEIKRQKGLAFFKLFAAYAEKDPNTALFKALRDTFIAEAAEAAFYTGTEKVEDDLKGAKRHGGKDGYRIDVDGSERILTGEQNKLVGELTNEQLADLAYKHNNGLLDNAKFATNTNYDFASRMQDSALLMQTMALRKDIQDVKEAIKSRPVTSWNFDGYGDFIKTTIENGITKKTTHKQNKPRI